MSGKKAYGSEGVTFEDIGGLSKEVKKIRGLVELSLKFPELFKQLGIEPPKGILLYGPPGTGKTLIAHAIASETDAHFLMVNCSEILQESETLRDVFEEAIRKAPSIIFLDEIDAIARKSEGHKSLEKRAAAELLSLMDGLKDKSSVLVIAATNVPDMIDPAFLCPGRFDCEIPIDVPDLRGREEILAIHTRGMALAEDVSLKHLAAVTHGFAGRHLAILCRKAGMHALQRALESLPPNSDISAITDLRVTMADFVIALCEVKPSVPMEFTFELPPAKWEDIGGLEQIKKRLQLLVRYFTHPELFRLKLCPPKGILLFGPPGTGKTLTVRALAEESGLNIIAVNCSLLLSRCTNNAEKFLHDVFLKARKASPCILFFDGLDALVPSCRGGEETSRRFLSQFLLEFDALKEMQVVVIGETNRIDLIDPALLRQGRFEEMLEFPYPDAADRRAIFEIHLRKLPLNQDVDLDLLAMQSEGLTGAEIEAVCRKASFLAAADFASDGGEIRRQHLERALEELFKIRTRK